ncbi:hypothetical protein WN55_00389 [Dufourea novaeangliae]|uniref:Uncharacterized protein n=1 Tax=Dufourea novaeangliae TaxID=178035 RepID=A0A154PFP2_DUFNO|nr:hypothetical protein WN55_00389 [Dufourea novaeangliae]
MYFFRLHNLRRQAEEVRKKRQKGRTNQGGQLGTNSSNHPQPTAESMHSWNKVHRGPSRLFERAPLQPSDSLDEIAFQIPRCTDSRVSKEKESLKARRNQGETLRKVSDTNERKTEIKEVEKGVGAGLRPSASTIILSALLDTAPAIAQTANATEVESQLYYP